jgi:hypothetical protein
MARFPVVREGVAVGLIASASVALFYAVIDMLAARGPFYTVNVLGRALFRELRHPTVLMLPLPLDVAAIAQYSLLHLGLSLAIGLTVAALIAVADRRPRWSFPVLAVIVGGFLVTILAVGYLSAPIRPVLPWWSIVVANFLSVLLATAWLLYRHPRLLGRFFPLGARPAGPGAPARPR